MEPLLSVEPPPGAYGAYALDVTLAAADPEVELLFALNRAPDPEVEAWEGNPVAIRLVDSASLVVFTRDAGGRVWGPYSFGYQLAMRDPEGFCVIQPPARTHYGAAEPIPLEVSFSLPAALSALELRAGGTRSVSLVSAAYPRGTTTLTLPPLTLEKAWTVECRVATPGADDIVGNTVDVHVDATPPVAVWNFDPPWSPPTHFRIDASDTGAGLAAAELCDAAFSHCVPMQAVSGGFRFSTAWQTGGGAFTARARVTDRAGNVRHLAAVSSTAAAVPPASLSVLPITAVTGAPFDLGAWLAQAGEGPPEEIRALDFTLLAAGAVPLAAGWNEFLYRPAGASAWRTVGIYRAGIALTLPARPAAAHRWLLYASSATIPVWQAAPVATHPVTVPVWSRPWFDVPRLFFVEDVNGDGVWGDAEPIYRPAVEDFGGAFLRRAVPVTAALEAVPGMPAVTTAASEVACGDCGAGGILRVFRATTPTGLPLERTSLGGIDLSAASPVSVTYPAEAADACRWFWDEDGNGVASADEPRALVGCSAAAVALHRGGGLTASADSSSLAVAGIPFGGAVTGFVEVRDGAAELLVRAPLDTLADRDGTGRRVAPLPFAASWPAQIRLWSSGGETATAPLPGTPAASTATVQIAVQDDQGQALSAAVEVRSDVLADFRIYDAATPSVTVQVAPGLRSRARALREGYVGEWVYLDEPAVTLPLLSVAMTGRALGSVRDEDGTPISGALIEWESEPWTSRTQACADGTFSLRALGAGRLMVRSPASGASLTQSLHLTAGDEKTVHVTLPAKGPRWPLGLQTVAGSLSVTGPAPAALFSGAGYVWGPRAEGAWMIESGTHRRAFTLPGAIPGLGFAGGREHDFSWSSELRDAALSVRCGGRVQGIPFGARARIDSLCWEWWGEWNGTAWFLGRPEPEAGFPAAGIRRFRTTVLKNGTYAAGAPVRFRDLLFGRTIEGLSGAGGALEVLLPHGYFAIEDDAGLPLRDAKGVPVFVAIHHLAAAVAEVHLP